MKFALGTFAAYVCLVFVPANADAEFTQIASPDELRPGFTVEDFEDDVFEIGASYSAPGGVRRLNSASISSSVTPSGSAGLTTENFPEPITISFDTPASSVGLWFGNDDPDFSDGFNANLEIFGETGLLETLSVTANLNDFADQFIGFNGDEAVTSVAIRFGDNAEDLFTYIDDVHFNAVPEPSSVCFLGIVAVALGFRRSRVASQHN